MGMHGPQVLVCGRDSSFKALIFIMKSVVGERGPFCQVLLICAFPMALNTKHSFGAVEFCLCIETGHYRSVWRPSSILSRCHMGHDIVNSTTDVRIHIITPNIELTTCLPETVETPSLVRLCIMNSLIGLLVTLQKVNFFLYH